MPLSHYYEQQLPFNCTAWNKYVYLSFPVGWIQDKQTFAADKKIFQKKKKIFPNFLSSSDYILIWGFYVITFIILHC